MLETSRASSFVPGSNLRSPSAGGAWLFLLPKLSFGRIVCVGVPSGPTLDALCRVGREVVVICPSKNTLRKARSMFRKRRVARVRAITGDDQTINEGSAELIVVASRRQAERLRRDETWPEVARLLRTDGVVYLETRGKPERLHGAVGGGGWLVNAGQQHFAISPGFGEVRAAAAAGDSDTVDALRERGMWARAAFVGIAGRVREVPLGPIGRRLKPRWAVLSGLGVSGWLGRAPLYLRDLARESGVDLDRYRWGMAAPGLYLSNKVLFLFFDRDTGSPAYVVKVTRDGTMNGRLQNEWRALNILRDQGLTAHEEVPVPAFHGTPGGLAVLGISGVSGRPFVDVDPGDAASLQARAAIGWLTELGAATAKPIDGGPAEAAGSLADLYERFNQIYALGLPHRKILESKIEAMAAMDGPFPAVFQHGDPGAWNLLVTDSGRVAFLDWEAAESTGMPLWDVFHLMRSLATLASRANGRSDTLAAFSEHFLADSPSNTFLTQATSAYCDRVGLSPELVEPIFYGCWMHRALKECTRIPPERLDRGHYLNLLRRCLDAHEEPPLRRLFSLDGSSATM
jgi:hypothetical protein